MKIRISLLALLFVLASCSSVTYRSPSGEIVHVGTAFGDATIASVTAPSGFALAGYESKNSAVTNKYINGEIIKAALPVGESVIDSTLKTAKDIATH